MHEDASRKTKDMMRSARASADESKAEARRWMGREQAKELTVGSPEAEDQGVPADAYLRQERESADEAVERERRRADQWMNRERGEVRSAETQIISGERRQTDCDLAAERSMTDSEFEKIVQVLLDEKTAHGRAAAALTSRDELMAIVSHDLRNPIGAIASCAEMLLDGSISLTSDVKGWIEFMQRNANSALRLVADLLDMERMSRGSFTLQPDVHDLVAIGKQAVQNAASAAAAKQVLLRFASSSPSLIIRCDSERMHQVLSNLLANAVKFTPQGGAVSVSVSELDSDQVDIAIRDTGIGISEGDQGRIFDRFSQIEKKDRRGLGLGLYVSKMIVEAHGGRLSVNSSLGQGSTFLVSLPK
jgi:signal transduction histidine kinase